MEFLDNIFEIELIDDRKLVGYINLIDNLGNLSIK